MMGSPEEGSVPSITDTKVELPAEAAPAFDAVGIAKDLLRTIRSGALATNDPQSGFPLATLVNVATDIDGSPVLLLSGLSLHTRNLAEDGRAALLLAQTGKGDPLAHPRLTVVGRCSVTRDERASRRFLFKHPKSRLYVELPDFAFWRMAISGVHLNGGFARAAKLTPQDLLTPMSGADEIAAAEPDVLAHMNEDHAEAVRLYATRLAGKRDAAWIMIGCDPDGIDLAAGDEIARVPFPHRVTSTAQLRSILKQLADSARGRSSR